MRGWLAVPIVLRRRAAGRAARRGADRDGDREGRQGSGSASTPKPASRPTNLASPWLEGPPLAEPRDEPRAVGDRRQTSTWSAAPPGSRKSRTDAYLLDPSDELTRFDPRSERYEELAPLPRPLNHVGWPPTAATSTSPAATAAASTRTPATPSFATTPRPTAGRGCPTCPSRARPARSASSATG